MNDKYEQHCLMTHARPARQNPRHPACLPLPRICDYVRHVLASAASLLLLATVSMPASADAVLDHPPRGAKVITLIEIGDHHGTMVPRPNMRPGDAAEGTQEAGLAKEAYIIKQIRRHNPHALLFNCGDTIQGSAEALYTTGQAMVDVLDTFRIDGYAPGNWDWLYGKDRTIELFGGGRWGVLAANAYDADTGERIFPAYRVYKVRGVKIGVIGMTGDRGVPAVPSSNVGLTFTGGEAELAQAVDDLRNKEKVDIVVLISELGLAVNTLLVDQIPGVDVTLTSDMHEETPRLVVTPVNKVLATDIGWGGSRVVKLDLFVRKARCERGDHDCRREGRKFEIVGHDFDYIVVGDQPEDRETARLVDRIRAPFLSGPDFVPHVNPISGYVLDKPLDTVVGMTGVDLFRGNFANGVMPTPIPPGVLEGTSHAMLTDAFRQQGGTDIGTIRGFRYGGYVRPGEVTLGDLYTYLVVGAQVATGDITGQQIKNALEAQIRGSLADPLSWGGGWLANYSGLIYDIDPNAAFGSRAQNIEVNGVPLDVNQTYSIAGYWFALQPDRIGAFRPVQNVSVITNPDGSIKDPTDVVADYLQATGAANPALGRIELLGSFPPPVFVNPEVQPLRGVVAP